MEGAQNLDLNDPNHSLHIYEMMFSNVKKNIEHLWRQFFEVSKVVPVLN
jgi:hypothetical protein